MGNHGKGAKVYAFGVAMWHKAIWHPQQCQYERDWKFMFVVFWPETLTKSVTNLRQATASSRVYRTIVIRRVSTHEVFKSVSRHTGQVFHLLLQRASFFESYVFKLANHLYLQILIKQPASSLFVKVADASGFHQECVSIGVCLFH